MPFKMSGGQGCQNCRGGSMETPAYAMGPRAAMNPSGAPTIRKSTHARRRARARFGRWRLGPRGSFHEGRGRFRELAIRTPTTRLGLDKGDDDNIRNDKRPPATERTRGADFQTRERIRFPPDEAAKRPSHLRSYLLTGTDGRSRISPRATG